MKTKQINNVTKLKAQPSDGLYDHIKILAKMTNTGNGYIFKFPAHSSVEQDNYVCLNYAEAEYLFKLLETVKESFDEL